MKSIVCATDCSINSVPALKVAHLISGALKLKLVVLHVFDLNVPLLTPLSTTYMKMEHEEYAARFKKLEGFCTEQLGTMLTSGNVEFRVKENPIINDAIIDTLIDIDALIVVMGSKGGSALKDFILGSNTNGMIRESPCPVLIVPPGLEVKPLERIAYATDFEGNDIRALSWLIQTIARPLGASLHVIHVNPLTFEQGEELMQQFQGHLDKRIDYDAMTFELMHSKHVFEALEDFVERGEIDMLVMLERSPRNYFGHMDLVKKMTVNISIPMLSINRTLFT